MESGRHWIMLSLIVTLVLSGCRILPRAASEQTEEPLPTYQIGFAGGSVQQQPYPQTGSLSLLQVVTEFESSGRYDEFDLIVLSGPQRSAEIAVSRKLLSGPGGAIPVFVNDQVRLTTTETHFPQNSAAQGGSFRVIGQIANPGPRQFRSTAKLGLLTNQTIASQLGFESIRFDDPAPEFLSVYRTGQVTSKPTVYLFTISSVLDSNSTDRIRSADIADGDVIVFSSRGNDPVLRTALISNQIRAARPLRRPEDMSDSGKPRSAGGASFNSWPPTSQFGLPRFSGSLPRLPGRN